MRLNTARLVHCVLSLAVLMLAACSTNDSYTIGGTVTGLTGSGGPQSVVLQNNGLDNLVISANGPFTFATALTSTSTTNPTYNVTILTQPIGQTCTVTGGNGVATSNIASVVVNCASTTANYAYVVNAGGGISQFTFAAGGALTPNLNAISAAVTGASPYAIAIAPSGTYAYVVNSGDDTLSQYNIGSDGALTAMTPPTVPSGGRSPYAIAIAPSGAYAYVANSGNGTIAQYTIGGNGALTAMTPATVPSGSGVSSKPESIVVDPSSRYVYVANYGDNTVSEYTIGGNGALTAMTPVTVAAGQQPISIAVDPSGPNVYVANYSSLATAGTVSEYTIGTGGVLTPNALSPIVSAGANPVSITADPAGPYVYVANQSSLAAAGTVSEFTISTGGALAPIGVALVGQSPYSVTVDHSSLYAYVANYGSGTVSQFIIGAGGALTANATATVSVGSSPISVITTQ